MKRRIAIGGLITIVLLVALYFGVAWYFSNVVLLTTPREVALLPIEETIADGIAEGNIPPWDYNTAEALSIDAGDGVMLTATFFENEVANDCAVILVHGRSGSQNSMMPYAPLFWQYDCHVMTFSMRSFGTSTDTLETFGFNEKHDVLVVADWIVDRTGLAYADIGLMGESLGAATALQTLFLTDDFAFIIADAAYQDMLTITSYQAQEQYGSVIGLMIPGVQAVISQRINGDMNDISPLAAIEGKSTPVLLTHSAADIYTPPSHSEAIFDAANADNVVLQVTDWGAAHGVKYHENVDGYSELVEDFIAEHVPTFNLS